MTEPEGRTWNPGEFREYNIKTTPIPRLDVKDPKVHEFIKENKPFIIPACTLVKSAEHWDLEYLEKSLGDGNFTVFLSKDHNFKYFNDKKSYKDFQPPTRQVEMKISEFARRINEWHTGDERAYLQQLLNSTVGTQIVEDFVRFDWEMLRSVQMRHGWGQLTSNLLLVAQEGCVTPCHYDEQENLFAQVRGCKRFLLFSPGQFECLYPYPVSHPHDRQSQVDFEDPDLRRFPKFGDVVGLEGVVGPGDVLYIPTYWWHHVESQLNDGPTVSITFWFRARPTGQITYPLKEDQKMAIMRNIEKMLVEALKDPEEVGPMLRALVLGRYMDCNAGPS